MPLFPFLRRLFRPANPFDAMTRADRLRLGAYLRDMALKRPFSPEQEALPHTLTTTYAGHLAPEAQLSALKDFMARETKRLLAPIPWPEMPKTDGHWLELGRRPRTPGFDVTREGTSWWGGLPTLGDQPWPKDPQGRPMTPVARIDLAEAARLVDLPDWPKTGALNLFVSLAPNGAPQGAVRHAVSNDLTAPPPLPRPPRHIFDSPLYPRRAMALHPGPVEAPKAEGYLFLRDHDLPLNRDILRRLLTGARAALTDAPAAKAGLERSLAKSKSDLVKMTANLAAGTVDPKFEASSRTWVAGQPAEIARQETRLAGFDAEVARLTAALPALEALTAGDPWAPLDPAPDVSDWTAPGRVGRILLDAGWGRLRSLHEAQDESLRLRAMAEDAAFATLPAQVQAALEGPHLWPLARHPHRLGGPPPNRQAPEALLLAQVACDRYAGFDWACDVQFWLRPADLRRGRWDKAFVTWDGN